MHQSIPTAPSTSPLPPPPGYCGAFSRLVSPGGGAFANCALPGGRSCQHQASDTHAVSCQNITTQRILLEKQADWLICQRLEKIEEAWKGMFSILCKHFFIAYQATITWRNRELSTWINVLWLLNQTSVYIIWRTSFHIYKTIHNS